VVHASGRTAQSAHTLLGATARGEQLDEVVDDELSTRDEHSGSSVQRC
jgi:hypothetical protein